jgi:hypothetical protein
VLVVSVKMCKAIVDGPPCITERLPKTPAKPWDHQITVPEGFPDTPTYAAASCKAQWEALRDSDLQAAFLAARSAVPGPAPLPRSQMVGTVISYLEAQEVALAWAVVKYAELVSGSHSAADVYTLGSCRNTHATSSCNSAWRPAGQHLAVRCMPHLHTPFCTPCGARHHLVAARVKHSQCVVVPC